MKAGWHQLLAIGLLGVFATSTLAAGDDALLRDLPDATNALIIVNLQGLKLSAVGKRENWAQKYDTCYAAGTCSFPPQTRKLVQGAQIDLATLSDTWAIGLARMERPTSMATIMRNEASAPDQLEGYPVTLSSRHAYFVELEPDLIGIVSPANRQHLGRWLRFVRRNKDVVISPYLTQAAAPAEPSQVIMALDMADGVDPARIRRGLTASKVLAAHPEFDVGDVAKIVSTVRGIRLSLRVDDAINGTLTVDFTGSVQPLKSIAKPLFLEALSETGLYLEDLANWNTEVSEKSVTLTGTLSTRGFRRVSMLVQTPSVTSSPLELGGANPPQRIENRPVNETVVSTQNYYSAIGTILTDLRDEKTKSTKDLANWYDRYAQRIDQLPILNVDPDLLNYGADVAGKLRAVGLSLKGVTIEEKYLQKMKTQAYGGLRQLVGYKPDPVNFGWGWGSGGGWGGWGSYGIDYTPAITSGANNIIAMKAVQDNLIIQGKYARDQIWAAIDQETAALRRKLTAKYNVEFATGISP
jgi:hypothetical protein